MKFDCKGSCDGTFICIIRIRNKEIENTEHWQTFQKDLKFLYQCELNERVCDKHAAACSFLRGALV